jgi:hypothetical protein
VAAVQYTVTHKQYTEYRERKIGKCGPCPVFASYTLAFALQLRVKHGKPQLGYRSREQEFTSDFSQKGNLV